MNREGERGQFGPALALTVVLAGAAILLLIAILLLVVHPVGTGFGGHLGVVNQQRQTVKTGVYLVAFLVLLPLALIAGPRLADTVAGGPNGGGLGAFAALVCATLAAALIGVRLSGGLPWGRGVRGLLAGVLAWSALAGALAWSVLRGGRLRWLHRLAGWTPAVVAVSGLLVFGVLVCVTSPRSLEALPLALGIAGAAAILLAYGRIRLPRLGRRGLVLDAVMIGLALLAIPDVVVFHNPVGIPNIYFDPGIVQFQQDWILGPTHQLLGGGALLVGDPVSQYGVGLLYFLAAWFHVAPIGYGTFGFLDGLLTALFYVAGYAVLRLAGVRRTVAVAAIALGILAFVYNFAFYVGQLPEEGPLRFGLPMLVLLGTVAGLRLPRFGGAARALALCAVGVSAVWALEAFAYCTVTYAGLIAAEAWLRDPRERVRWLLGRVGLAVGAWMGAHVVFALGTLAGTGQLPHWGQYLAYAHEFLLGGQAGAITYSFADWSPGLAAYGAALVSAAALVLLARRRPGLVRSHPRFFVALAGATAYAIGLLSYTDNRSSTYLFLYVALPLLMAGVLWLGLALSPTSRLTLGVRRGMLAGALSIVVLLVSGAWPSISTHFSRTALAHAYPGGGLRTAIHRLWHPPPIDPRSLHGVALVRRYIPGRRVVILLPTVPDLGTEILMRSHRYNLLPIGDPKADGLVPSVWLPRMRTAVRGLRAGRRVLIDEEALRVIGDLRHSRADIVHHAIDGGGTEVEWILRALDGRFLIRPLIRSADGLIVAQLASR